MEKEFLIYGKEVTFPKEEIQVFEDCGLDLDNDFLELLLHYAGIDRFEESLDEEERHDLCIRAIKEYDAVVEEVLSEG